MTTSGYSDTPLLKKLGIAEPMKVLLINPPDNYFDLLEHDIHSHLVKKKEKADFVHFFVQSNEEFEREMVKLKPVYKANPNLIIWVSWFKKTAGISTNITEDIIRGYALLNGLVDIKVCAVSEIWSGLKLVVPKAMR